MPSLNTGNAILSNPIKVETTAYNVGIGGAASSSFKLQVTGTSNLTGALTGTSALFNGSSFGFGTVTPLTMFDIRQPFAKTDTTRRDILYASNDASPSGLRISITGGASQSVRNAHLQTTEWGIENSGNLLLQPFGGNVGIGTTTPTAGKFVVLSSDTTIGIYGQNVSSSTTLGDSFVTRFRNGFDGNGVYSLASFQVQNSSGVDQVALIGAQSVSGASTYQPNIIFGVRNGASTYAEYMRITSGGDLGIGTTPPTTSNFPHLFSGRNFVTFSGSSNDVYIGSNFYYNGGFLARYSEPSIMINSSNGDIIFGNSASGTANGALTVTEKMRITSSGNVLIAQTSAPTASAGTIMMLSNTIFFNYTSGVSAPYTQSLRVDIVWNNWGSNHVAALIDVDFLAREFGNLGGVSFGRIYAISSGGASTFNATINTANVTTANATLTVSSPASFMLRLLFTPTNVKDYIGCFIRIPISTAGTGSGVVSITASLV